MAGASMNNIKARIKSVEGTMQITKAMELVATSKLRRAKERAERSRPFHEALTETVDKLLRSSDIQGSPWCCENEGKTLIVVIAGDRGLAGGYNANVFRLAAELTLGKDFTVLPIGKKAIEHYRYRGADIYSDKYAYTEDVGVGGAMRMGADIARDFLLGKFTRVLIAYTHFASMLSQIPKSDSLLPLSHREEKADSSDPIFGAEAEELLSLIVPEYIGGIIHSAICESLASESAARRTAMNSANKNAEEIIGTLTLKYNRARQAVITQEITEIVSGAEAL